MTSEALSISYLVFCLQAWLSSAHTYADIGSCVVHPGVILRAGDIGG